MYHFFSQNWYISLWNKFTGNFEFGALFLQQSSYDFLLVSELVWLRTSFYWLKQEKTDKLSKVTLKIIIVHSLKCDQVLNGVCVTKYNSWTIYMFHKFTCVKGKFTSSWWMRCAAHYMKNIHKICKTIWILDKSNGDRMHRQNNCY